MNRRDFIKMVSLTMLAGSKRAIQDKIWNANRTDPSTPNILILVFDTLSALHVSLYGYRRDTTPNIKRFAEQSTIYHNHYAGGNFTTPGTASLLTGTYPWTHRAYHLQAVTEEEHVLRNLFCEFGEKGYTRLGLSHNYMVNILLYQFRDSLDEFILPQEIVQKDYNFSDDIFLNDYIVASRSEGAYFKLTEGYPSSFLLFLFLPLLKILERRKIEATLEREFPRGLPGWHDMVYPLEKTINWMIDYLPSLQRPFLSYIHLMPPHQPYRPSSEFVGIFQDGWIPRPKPEHIFHDGRTEEFLAEQRVYYDEYIAYVDSEFGRLIDFLSIVGLLDNIWIILTSDHGELFERGIWQHTTPVLYEPIIRVPLLISGPGQETREDVYVNTSCVDLLPTLLHLKGYPIPHWCEGKDLPPFSNSVWNNDRSIFVVEAKSNSKHRPLENGTIAMIKDRYKLISYLGYEGLEDTFEMYDLVNDPEELNNLINIQPSLAYELQHELKTKLEDVNRPYSK